MSGQATGPAGPSGPAGPADPARAAADPARAAADSARAAADSAGAGCRVPARAGAGDEAGGWRRRGETGGAHPLSGALIANV